jgi:hypothetical protein
MHMNHWKQQGNHHLGLQCMPSAYLSPTSPMSDGIPLALCTWRNLCPIWVPSIHSPPDWLCTLLISSLILCQCKKDSNWSSQGQWSQVGATSTCFDEGKHGIPHSPFQGFWISTFFLTRMAIHFLNRSSLRVIPCPPGRRMQLSKCQVFFSVALAMHPMAW